MTAKEMYRACLTELQYQSTRTMTPEEFNYHIEVGTIEYVKTRYMCYERFQKPIDDLQVLKVQTDGIGGMPPPLLPNGTVPNAQTLNLPIDYFRLTAVAVVVRYFKEPCKTDGSLSDRIACTPLKDDQWGLIFSDYYKKPAPRFPRLYYTQRNNQFVFLAGLSLVHQVYLSYIRTPVFVKVDDNGESVVDSEFKAEQSYEIVKWTVSSYLEKIEEMRQQTFAAFLQQSFESPNVQQTPPID